jgi:hypothetical protein
MTSSRELAKQYESAEDLASLVNAAILSVKRSSLGLDEPADEAEGARKYLASLVGALAEALTEDASISAIPGPARVARQLVGIDRAMSGQDLAHIADGLRADRPLAPEDLADLDRLTRAINAAASSAYSQVVRG